MRHKKIPGKKHKGYKDPEAQQARRQQQLSLKINSAPMNDDEQEIPKKLRLLINSKNNVLKKPKVTTEKSEVTNYFDDKSYGGEKDDSNLLDSTKHMGYEMTLPGMTKPLKPIPVFKQMPGEKKKSFFRRMDLTAQAVMKRKQYEEKFDVDVTINPATGKTKVQDRVKDEIDLEMEKVRNKNRSKKGIVIKTKEEKRQLRRAKDKERKRKKKRCNVSDDNQLDFHNPKFSDRVKFNEVVHAPPDNLLRVESYAERKPGRKNNLLLRKKLNNESNPKINNNKTHIQKISVSLARKSMLEQERKRVIEQYRKVKKNN